MATLPTGVEIRGNSICIWFIYRGKRCREILKGWANTSTNIKKAGNLRSMIVSEINLGEFSYHNRFPTSKNAAKYDAAKCVSSFSELTEQWLKTKSVEVSPGTFVSMKSQISVLNRVVGEHIMVETITHNNILAYRHELLHGSTFYSHRPNKVGRSVRTVETYISLLCRVLKFAHRSGFITSKPFEEITKLKSTKAKPDPLLKSEYSALLAAMRGQTKNLFQLAFYSGMRHGELSALAWEDIDLDTGIIHVSRNLNKLGIFGPPKTHAGNRIITLLAPALEALRAQRALTELQPRTEITFHYREYRKTEQQHVRFVFQPREVNNEKKPHYCSSTIATLWDTAIKRSKVRRRTPYHTRHTYACWLLSAGANPAFIASQMGHENSKMVFEVYGAWIEEMNNEQVKALNTKLAI